MNIADAQWHLCLTKRWIGQVSDSDYGANHSKMAAEHGNANMSAHDGTLASLKTRKQVGLRQSLQGSVTLRTKTKRP